MEAFLNQVEKNCGTLYVGSNQIKDVLGVSSDDTSFIDETGKHNFGKDGCAGAIKAFYPAGRNRKSLNCTFDLLDNRFVDESKHRPRRFNSIGSAMMSGMAEFACHVDARGLIFHI